MSTFSAGSIEAKLVLRREEFNRDLDAAKADAAKFSQGDVTKKFRADTKQASADLDKLAVKADRVGAKTETIKVRADTKSAETALDRIMAKADKAAKSGGGLGPVWLGPAVAALPGAISLLGVATGAAAALGATMATGGIALAGYGAVAKGVVTQSVTAASKVQAAQQRYNAAVTSGTKQATAYRTEQKAILLAYAQMSPAQVTLSRQLGTMSDNWQALKKSVTPAIALSVTPWITGITGSMGVLKPVVTDVSVVIGDLGRQFAALTGSPSFAAFGRFIGTEGSSAIAAGGGAILSFLKGFTILLPQLSPLIDAVNAQISGMGLAFLGWAQSDAPRADIQKFLAWMSANGPATATLLKNVGLAVWNLSKGLGSSGVGAAEVRLLSDFFGMIAALPPGLAAPITTLAASLLLLSKFGFGRKVISIGVSVASKSLSALLSLISGGKISIGGGTTVAAELRGAFVAGGDYVAGAIRAALGAGGVKAGGELAAGEVAGGARAGGELAAGELAGGGGAAGLLKGGLLAGAAFIPAALALAVPAILSQIHHSNGQSWLSQGPGNPSTSKNPSAWNSWDQLGVDIKHWFTMNLAGPTQGDKRKPKQQPKGPGGPGAGQGAGYATGPGSGLRPTAKESANTQWIASMYGITLPAAFKAEEAAGVALNTNWKLHTAAVDSARTRLATYMGLAALLPGATNKNTIAMGNYTASYRANGAASALTIGYRRTLLAQLLAEHVPYKTAVADVAALTTGTKNLGDAYTILHPTALGTINDLIAAGMKASVAKTDVNNFSTAVLGYGTTSDRGKAARAQLVKDLEHAGLTAQQANTYVANLATSIANLPRKIDTNIVLSGTGSWNVTEQKVAVAQVVKGMRLLPHAAGGLITGGVPNADSVPILGMPGEVVVPVPLVNAGAVDHLRGRLPGFGAGGVIGGTSLAPPSMGTWVDQKWSGTYDQMTAAMQSAMVAAVNKAIAAAKAAAAAASYAAGAVGDSGARSGNAALAQRYAASLMSMYGWSQSQMSSLIPLWNEESGWNAYALNASSGAAGIPQALGHGNVFALGDYKSQIIWGLDYIRGRYGSPAAAYAFENSHTPHWYGTGTQGAAPGWGVVGERGPELVRFHGGEQVLPHATSMAALGIPGYASGAGALAEAGRVLMASPAGRAKHAHTLNALMAAASKTISDDTLLAAVRGIGAAEKAKLAASKTSAGHQLKFWTTESSELMAYRTQLANSNATLRKDVAAAGDMKLTSVAARLTKQLTGQVETVQAINKWLGPTAAQTAAAAAAAKTAADAAKAAADGTAAKGPSGQDLITAWLTAQGWVVGGTITPPAAKAMQWFDTGGRLPEGIHMVGNQSGGSERILSHAEEDAFSRLASGGGSNVEKLLGQIVQHLAAAPGKTAAGVGDAINGAARGAVRRGPYATQ